MAVRSTRSLGSMNGDIEIRTMAPGDSIEELTCLLHAAYASLGAMGLNYTAVDQSSDVTEARIRTGTCFVATSSGKVVGTILVEPPFDDPLCPYFAHAHVASAHQLAVAPSHQRKGLGTRLLKRAESWALASGYSELVLDTAEPAHHLVSLYERRGYSRVGFVQWEGKRYRSVLMAKKLEPAA